MAQREYLNLGEQIQNEAWEAFERWCQEYDPEGNMYFVDLAEAYHWLAVSAPKTGDRVGRAGDDRAKVMARRYDVGAPPSYDDDVPAAASAAASRNWLVEARPDIWPCR
jgi:hypothetical protein